MKHIVEQAKFLFLIIFLFLFTIQCEVSKDESGKLINGTNVSGLWSLLIYESEDSHESNSGYMELEQEGNTITGMTDPTGTDDGQLGRMSISGTIDGDSILLEFAAIGASVSLAGTVDDDYMGGTWTSTVGMAGVWDAIKISWDDF